MAKKALGKGLGALLAIQDEKVSRKSDIQKIPIKNIQPNSLQPRKFFDENKLQELADSIKQKGLIQPIVVSQDNDKYEIIVGERRWRACQLIGLHNIPAIIKEASSYEKLELALIENIQREDLNPIEEASSFKELLDNLKLTQEQLSAKIGKSRAAIANTMRLLKLPPAIQNDIINQVLSGGHARSLLSLKDDSKLLKAREIVIQENLSVRQTEKLIQKMNNGQLQEDHDIANFSPDMLEDKKEEVNEDKIEEKPEESAVVEAAINVNVNEIEIVQEESLTEPEAREDYPAEEEAEDADAQDIVVVQHNNPETQQMEKQLQEYFNVRVYIKKHPQKDTGKIEINYNNQDELKKIIQLLGLKR